MVLKRPFSYRVVLTHVTIIACKCINIKYWIDTKPLKANRCKNLKKMLGQLASEDIKRVSFLEMFLVLEEAP